MGSSVKVIQIPPPDPQITSTTTGEFLRVEAGSDLTLALTTASTDASISGVILGPGRYALRETYTPAENEVVRIFGIGKETTTIVGEIDLSAAAFVTLTNLTLEGTDPLSASNGNVRLTLDTVDIVATEIALALTNSARCTVIGLCAFSSSTNVANVTLVNASILTLEKAHLTISCVGGSSSVAMNVVGTVAVTGLDSTIRMENSNGLAFSGDGGSQGFYLKELVAMVNSDAAQLDFGATSANIAVNIENFFVGSTTATSSLTEAVSIAVNPGTLGDLEAAGVQLRVARCVTSGTTSGAIPVAGSTTNLILNEGNLSVEELN